MHCVLLYESGEHVESVDRNQYTSSFIQYSNLGPPQYRMIFITAQFFVVGITVNIDKIFEFLLEYSTS